MLEKIGLAAVVKFDGQQAITGMKAVSSAASSMAEKVSAIGSKAGAGMTSLGGGLAMTGLAFAPLTAAMGVAGDTAITFEKQMDAVGSVARASAEEQAALEKEAKRLGITTVFTATQAGQAMEALAQQGFEANQILGATAGVTALAAAGTLSLDSAANITAATLSAFQLPAERATSVADVLALTAARTGTDVTKLGEAIKFAAPNAQRLGIDVATTATFLGALGDTAFRGTIAGTAFKNALGKLAAPSKKGAELMAAYNIQIAQTADGSVDLVKTFDNISRGFSKMTKLQKAAAAHDLLGERGQPMLAAFEAARAKKEDDGKGGQTDKMTKLMAEMKDQFENGGAAAEMAERRLSNFAGAVERLKGTLEGLSIEAFANFLPGGAETLRNIAGFIEDVVMAMQTLSEGISGSDADFEGLNMTAVAVAKGIAAAIRDINTSVEWLKDRLGELADKLGLADNPEVVENITRIIVLFSIVAAVIGPILLALGGIAVVIGSVVIPAITMLADVAAVVFSGAFIEPLLIIGAIIGSVLFVISSLSSSTESLGETASRIWNGIMEVVTTAVDWIGEEWTRITTLLAPVMEWLDKVWMDFKVSVGREIKELVGGIIAAFEFLKPFFRTLFNFLGRIIEVFAGAAMFVIGGVLMTLKEIIHAVKVVALFIIEGIVGTLQLVAKALVKVAPSGSLPDSIVEFANAPAFRMENQNLSEVAENFGGKKETAALDILDDPNFNGKSKAVGDGISDLIKAKKGSTKTEVAVTVDDNRTLEVDNCVKLDGRKVAANQAKHQQEVNERRGFKATPWQKRLVVEQGASVSVGM